VEPADGAADLLDVPCETVARIVCFGPVGVSAGLRSWALCRGVEMVFVSSRGRYQGMLCPADGGTRVARLRSQLAAADDPSVAIGFARAVVAAKISKQVTLLTRMAGDTPSAALVAALPRLKAARDGVAAAATREEIMGWEGIGARCYFDAVATLLPAELDFTGRTRRPPHDVVNAALSYGYAVLAGEAETALRVVGLDPAIGLLHAEQRRRPSLALDLMEEFRPHVVDQVVVTAATRGWLRPVHGEPIRAGAATAQDLDDDPQDASSDDAAPGVWLTPDGRRVVIGAYERRMLQKTSAALPGFTGTLRRLLFRQAERLALHLTTREPGWSGLAWR
jgi:CRISPR-associated protein Cas1